MYVTKLLDIVVWFKTLIFENEDGTLMIYDWKRCKDIVKTNNWNKYSTNSIISHLPDTNYWHYTLQLNLYKMILETKYGFTVKDIQLVVIHPENQVNNYCTSMNILCPSICSSHYILYYNPYPSLTHSYSYHHHDTRKVHTT